MSFGNDVSMSNAKQRPVLFIQGGGEDAHAWDAKLVTSLRDRLGAGYVVRFPVMPNEADPDYETWKRCICEELTTLAGDVVLVGHSIGASVLIKALADGVVERPMAGIFLIATPFWHDHEVWRWKEVELPTNAADRLPRGVPLFAYHGREDEIVPFSHLDLYAKTFPQAIVRALDDRNHQLNDDLTEVADDIRRVCR